MKKLLMIVAAVGFLVATPSCKKGENDPFLSLSSRKSRLANDWVVTSSERTWTNTYTDGDVYASSESYNGSNVTTAWSEVVDGTPDSGVGSDVITVQKMEYTITKDGKWTSVFDRTVKSTSDVGGLHTVQTTVITELTEGQWSFVAGNKGNYKNKERVQMLPLKATTTDRTTTVSTLLGVSTTSVGDLYTSVDNSTASFFSSVYDIDMLKGKEMIWKLVGDYSGSDSVTDSETGEISTSSSSSKSTFEIHFSAAK